jgi:hypothetical protein
MQINLISCVFTNRQKLSMDPVNTIFGQTLLLHFDYGDLDKTMTEILVGVLLATDSVSDFADKMESLMLDCLMGKDSSQELRNSSYAIYGFAHKIVITLAR